MTNDGIFIQIQVVEIRRLFSYFYNWQLFHNQKI